MWKKITTQLVMVICLIIVASFFMRDLIIPGLPKLHDSNPHIARMIAYHTALEDGQYPPMWAKEMMGGIGSPVMMLNYQLPYMMSELFVQSGFSIFDSYKLVLALSFIASAIFTYTALNTKYGLLSAWTGALIYALAPYRFVDIYVRGALGESLSFIFPPLLIWGFSKKSWPVLIIGWAGLFLTHPTASAVFSAFFLGYVLITADRQRIGSALKLFWGPYITALLIASFNLLPTILLTKHTYYSPLLSDTLLMFPTFSQLFHSTWGYGVSLPGPLDGMSFELGFIQWIILFVGVIASIRSKNMEVKYLTICSIAVLFFILPISIPVYKVLHLTSIIDFPWRLLLCLVFATAWLGAEIVDQLIRKSVNPYLVKIIVLIVTLMLLVQSLPVAHTDSYWDKSLSWFARETGDSYGEYAPLSRETRDSAPFWKRVEFVKGEGTIDTLISKSNAQIYRVNTLSAGEIRINTAYFPGWQIPENCYVTKRTLSHIDDSGLIGCRVQKGEQTVEIKFVAPPVQKLGNLLTLSGIGVYLWILFRSFYQPSTKKTQ